MDKHLHIISLDVPYPVDYGGVFDIYCKLKALHSAGVQVYLHCFHCHRGQQPELKAFCKEVYYYQRQEGHKGFSHKLPYIVASRADKTLLERLLQDDYPILLEGVHCSFLLQDERFTGRKIILRLHNVEYIYYRRLFHSCRSWWKKVYYLHESRLLKQYEADIAEKPLVLTMSEKDAVIYRNEFNADNVAYLPVFLPFNEVQASLGIGCYCLYHGNLSVPENEEAVRWLLKNVFNEVHVPLLIAGKDPSPSLERLISRHPHACLVKNPSEQEIKDIIAKAQINVLPAFNNTGVKLKLLNALFNGRHCVVNDEAVAGTGLEPACHIGTNAEAFQQIIVQLYRQPFAEEEVRLRKRLLEDTFNNEQNARHLIQWIW